MSSSLFKDIHIYNRINCFITKIFKSNFGTKNFPINITTNIKCLHFKCNFVFLNNLETYVALAFTDVIYLGQQRLQGNAEILTLASKGLKKFPISQFPLNRLVNRDWLFLTGWPWHILKGGGGGIQNKRTTALILSVMQANEWYITTQNPPNYCVWTAVNHGHGCSL